MRLWVLIAIPCVFLPALSDFKNTLYVVLNYIFKLSVCVHGIMQHEIMQPESSV